MRGLKMSMLKEAGEVCGVEKLGKWRKKKK